MGEEYIQEATKDAVMKINEQLGDYLSFEEVSIKTQRLILGLIACIAMSLLTYSTRQL